jgi:putative PIN family toxin of toxin-antitoxin system
MTPAPVRVVFDCNIYFQALISPHGPAAACLLAAMRGQVELFCSEYVVGEFRDVASRPELRARFRITDERVDRIVEAAREAATFIDHVPEVYTHPVDPDDSHYVNLALATNARLLVSRDKHLLKLVDVRSAEGRDFTARFPQLRILEPAPFLREIGVPVELPPAPPIPRPRDPGT